MNIHGARDLAIAAAWHPAPGAAAAVGVFAELADFELVAAAGVVGGVFAAHCAWFWELESGGVRRWIRRSWEGSAEGMG
jgi:hypothetical protein